ncbi:MAG: hypothetical protein R6V85_18815 [Polyangia bacterium]
MSHKVKIPNDLYQNAAKLAELAGYASVDEFIVHIIEKETEKIGSSEDEEEIKKRLKGLGYIS